MLGVYAGARPRHVEYVPQWLNVCSIDLYLLRIVTRHADNALTSLRTLVASIVLPREPLSSVTYMGGARLEKMYRK